MYVHIHARFIYTLFESLSFLWIINVYFDRELIFTNKSFRVILQFGITFDKFRSHNRPILKRWRALDIIVFANERLKKKEGKKLKAKLNNTIENVSDPQPLFRTISWQ